MRALLVVAFLLAARPAFAQAPAITVPAMPRALASLRLTATTVFADSMLGTQYRYDSGRSLVVDVFVQPSLTLDRRPAPAEEIFHRAVASFRTILRNRPGGEAAWETFQDATDTVQVEGRSVPRRIVAVRRRPGAPEQLRVWHIYFLRSRYVRVMCDFPFAPDPAARSADALRTLEDFEREAIAAIIAAWRP